MHSLSRRQGLLRLRSSYDIALSPRVILRGVVDEHVQGDIQGGGHQHGHHLVGVDEVVRGVGVDVKVISARESRGVHDRQGGQGKHYNHVTAGHFLVSNDHPGDTRIRQVIQLCCQLEMLKHDISLIQEVPAENHEQISRVLLEFIERQCVLKEKCHMWRRACGVAVLAQCMASVFIICIGFYYFYRASEQHDGHFDHVQCGVVPSAGVLLLLLRHGDKDKGEEGRIIIPNRPVVSLAPPLATQPGHPWPFQLSGF